jgi:hypothetical protein
VKLGNKDAGSTTTTASPEGTTTRKVQDLRKIEPEHE